STSISREEPAEVDRAASELSSLASGSAVTPQGVHRVLTGPALPAGPALAAGAVSVVAPSACELLEKLDGTSVRTARGQAVLSTACPGGSVTVRFEGMGPVRSVLHAVSTPLAVYLLIVLGAWGIAFEVTQPGVGLAGVAGGVFLALAGYGLAVIPVDWVGVGLL